MESDSKHEITQLLIAWRQGDQAAQERLMALVYQELRRQARRFMQRERQGHLLQTTALVHETYLRLIDQSRVSWQNRAHFFGVAAEMMRRVLLDFARAERNAKRGGGTIRVSLGEAAGATEPREVELVALDDALKALSALAPRQSRVVEMRFFGGLSNEEAAKALGVSPATVRHDWSLAKAWLYRELSKQ
jgi:RNA polymerase sigma factor (TIGR02999 family)